MTVNWTLAIFAYQWAEGKTVGSIFLLCSHHLPSPLPHSKDILELLLLIHLSQSLREGMREGRVITIKA